MPIKITGQTLDITINKLKEGLSAKAIASVAKQELIKSTIEFGWNRFSNSIQQSSIDNNTERLFITNDNNSKAIAGYLNFGTPAHGPVSAKAMRFIPKGGSSFIFRKRVTGIKAFNWYGFTPRVLAAIYNYITDTLNK